MWREGEVFKKKREKRFLGQSARATSPTLWGAHGPHGAREGLWPWGPRPPSRRGPANTNHEPYNNNQASNDQEWNHQWENFDEEAYQHTIDQRLLNIEECTERCRSRLEQCVKGSEEQCKEDPQQLHKATNPFSCLTVEEELRIEEEIRQEKGRKEATQLVKSSDSSEGDLGEVLLKFEEELRLEKEGKKVDLVKEIAELISLNVNYILKADMLEKERDSEKKKAQELSVYRPA
ncbi:hypothetical protein Q3G72_024329 [Acer saccharum]|nr:hypothetical protein Q3G72_024329 [Acer saccharum]